MRRPTKKELARLDTLDEAAAEIGHILAELGDSTLIIMAIGQMAARLLKLGEPGADRERMRAVLDEAVNHYLVELDEEEEDARDLNGKASA